MTHSNSPTIIGIILAKNFDVVSDQVTVTPTPARHPGQAFLMLVTEDKKNIATRTSIKNARVGIQRNPMAQYR